MDSIGAHLSFSNGGLFCARSDGGWRKKSSSQVTIVDGYDFDMVDYTDYHYVSLFVSHKSVAVYKSSRLPVARMIT